MTDTNQGRSSHRLLHADVLNRCRDMALVYCNAQMAALFENASAALLDFAERAENNQIQGRFFEAMGLIQRRRPEMELKFRQEIVDGFEDLGKLAQPVRQGQVNSTAATKVELALVEPDEMEESVAAENLVIRANANLFPELYALSQRLGVLYDGKKFKEQEIPSGPYHLVRAFRVSMGDLDLDVKIKVILFALFDKFLIKQAKTLYDELNGSLKAAGILPNVKPLRLRPDHRHNGGPANRVSDEPAAAEEPSGTAPEVVETPSLGTELFESIIELMSSRRAGRRKPTRGTAGSGAQVPPSVAAAESRFLVSAIDEAQSRTIRDSGYTNIARPEEIAPLEVDTAFIAKVRETLGQEREQILSHVDREKLAPMDADLIDLIGMLFEYMLKDPTLPNLAKALLSYLHTPYLKVALIDRRLLVDAQHPARRLLDQMVEAGSLWIDESNPQRGIFPVMQEVVDRVLQEFTNDVSLFDELLNFFEEAMREQQRKTDTVEQRTQEAARGREKLRLAKRRASHEIQSLIQDRPLPQPVMGFLTKTWSDHLAFILLRDQREDRSDAWREAVKTARDLIALFDRRADPAEQRVRRDATPELRARISDAIRPMGSYAHGKLDALFTLLGSPGSWEAELSEDIIAQPVAGAGSEAYPTASFPPGSEMVPGAAEAEITEEEQAVMERLRELKFGTWFECRSEAGGASRRIKLSWLSPLTATCMFVDRSGLQAEIKTLHELAQEIVSGRAKVIPRPKHPFIERTLVSIRKMLRGEKENTVGDSGRA